MRLEPLYTLRFHYPDHKTIELSGAKGTEEHHFLFAEGEAEGRVAGTFRGSNHPRRRTDETYAMNLQGFIETHDGGTVLLDYTGYGRSRARSDELYARASMSTESIKFRRQVVGFARHVTDSPKYAWLNDAVCAIAGEVRSPVGVPPAEAKQGSIQLVFSVAEVIWEPPPESPRLDARSLAGQILVRGSSAAPDRMVPPAEPPRTLAAPPLRPPWTLEGHDLSRVLALSDGIFAFAMTLLVLGLALPPKFDPSQVGAVLLNLNFAFLAYFLSFFVIWFYWRAHRQVFSYIVSFDQRLLTLNITFLLFIAIMPFVTNLLSGAPGELIAVAIYALTQVAAGGLLSALWYYASQSHRHIDRSVPPEWVRYLTVGSVISPAVFAASLPIALWNPSYCEFSWLSLFALQFLLRRRAGKDGERPRLSSPIVD
jgi:uncharacterized membrane protein